MSRFLLALSALLALFAGAACADTGAAPAPAGTIDIGAIINGILTFLAPAFGAVVIWILHRAVAAIERWAGVKHQQALQDELDLVIQDGLAWAAHNLEGNVQGMKPVDIRNAMAAQAISHILPAAGAALEGLGLTADILKQRVLAALGSNIDIAAAASPAALSAPAA